MQQQEFESIILEAQQALAAGQEAQRTVVGFDQGDLAEVEPYITQVMKDLRAYGDKLEEMTTDPSDFWKLE